MANEDKSTRYQRQRRRAAIATAILDVALLAGVLATGLSRAIADAAAASWDAAAAATVGFVLALLAARTLLILPLAYASEVVHERRYGRARVALVHWFGAYLWRAVVLAAALAGAALVIQVAVWWSPAAWWAPASAVLAAAIVGGAALVPALAARSAAELAPIGRAELAARLTALAARAGAAGVPILEWKLGPRAAGATALLVGFGPSRRILVTDAVLDTHADDEVEVIVAHELAHHRRGDAWWTAAMAAGALALGLYAAARVLPLAAGALALQGPGDAAALPLVGAGLRRRGGAAGAARQPGVARPGAARRSRCPGLDAQRARARADAEAVERGASRRRPPARVVRGVLPSSPGCGGTDCRS